MSDFTYDEGYRIKVEDNLIKMYRNGDLVANIKPEDITVLYAGMLSDSSRCFNLRFILRGGYNSG